MFSFFLNHLQPVFLQVLVQTRSCPDQMTAGLLEYIPVTPLRVPIHLPPLNCLPTDVMQKYKRTHSSSVASNLHALPVELLVCIFTFYAEALDDPLLPSPAWLPITHVCHHWRTIALSHGPLWTSITRGLSLRWIKAFMERSRTMLMDFDIPLPLHGQARYLPSLS
jgi:hypothetical protein